MKNKNDDYYVDFRGVKLTKLESNRVGVGIIFGLLGVIIVFVLPANFREEGFFDYLIILLFAFVGYFFIAPRIFKNKNK